MRNIRIKIREGKLTEVKKCKTVKFEAVIFGSAVSDTICRKERCEFDDEAKKYTVWKGNGNGWESQAWDNKEEEEWEKEQKEWEKEQKRLNKQIEKFERDQYDYQQYGNNGHKKDDKVMIVDKNGYVEWRDKFKRRVNYEECWGCRKSFSVSFLNDFGQCSLCEKAPIESRPMWPTDVN